MPISIVVGGQFGSEGKGKVACFLAEQRSAFAAVRVGGPNSGHTVVDKDGQRRIFRQLPTPAVLSDVICVISAGSYVDLDVLASEVRQVGLQPHRLRIDPKAVIIDASLKEKERLESLRERVGSTLTGTGAAVSSRINRLGSTRFARDEPALAEYLEDTSEFLYNALSSGERVIAEGSQGFGLSVIHSPHFPFVTSRDTTAAGVLSEIGLSPLLVDDIALVLRAFPIRVPGNSGPLPQETTWDFIAQAGGFTEPFSEFTSVTKKQRRVAQFDSAIVRSAIQANSPTHLFLNHVDYIDSAAAKSAHLTPRARSFVEGVEKSLGMRIDFVGLGASSCLPFDATR